MQYQEREINERQKNFVRALRDGPLYANYSQNNRTHSRSTSKSKQQTYKSDTLKQGTSPLQLHRKIDKEGLIKPSQLSLDEMKKRFERQQSLKKNPTLINMKPKSYNDAKCLTRGTAYKLLTEQEEEEYGQYLNNQRLIKKAFSQLRYNLEDDLKLSQAFHNRRQKLKVLLLLQKATKKQRVRRRHNRNVRKISRLFQLKTLMKAWKQVTGNHLLKAYNEHKKKQPLKYCVKYSDFCKCERCTAVREQKADIVPKSENSNPTTNTVRFDNIVIQNTFRDDFSNEDTLENVGKVIPLSEIYKDKKQPIGTIGRHQQSMNTRASSTNQNTPMRNHGYTLDSKGTSGSIQNNKSLFRIPSSFRSNYIYIEEDE